MRDVSKRDLPEDGARYDMTLHQIGYQNMRSKNPLVVVRAMIDNGEHCGKFVSHPFNFGDHLAAEEWRQFYQAIGVEPNGSRDKQTFLQPFRAVQREARFSAILHVRAYTNNYGQLQQVNPFVFEGNFKVKYEMIGFEPPENEAERIIGHGKSKFSRA